MKSMTGYGKGCASDGGREVTVEIKAVNNRFLEINTRLPKTLFVLDDVLKKLVQQSIKRGTVEVCLYYASTAQPSQRLSADMNLINAYSGLAKRVNALTGIPDDLSFSALMRVPEMIKPEPDEGAETAIAALATQAAAEALVALDVMRQKEGDALKADLSGLLNGLVELLNTVKQRAPRVVDEYRAKLKERIAEYLDGVEHDEARLLNEVAFFADKADINEEIQRLESHLSQFAEVLESDEQQGRKLDFISQEIGREVNTIGSKGSDATLAKTVIEMKNILEKIKEQIRNAE